MLVFLVKSIKRPESCHMCYFSLCDSVTIVRDDFNFGDGGIVLKEKDLVEISGSKKWSNAL